MSITMALRHSSLIGKSLLKAIRPVSLTTPPLTRHFSLTPLSYAKKILLEESESVTTISAVPVESARASQLVKTGKEGEHACPLCALNLNLKHTDVLILSQFLRPDGCLLPGRVTGLCKKQQKRIKYLVAMSQKAGLMPNLTPSNSKKDPKRRSGSKKLNRYFDESTIEPWLIPRRKIIKD